MIKVLTKGQHFQAIIKRVVAAQRESEPIVFLHFGRIGPVSRIGNGDQFQSALLKLQSQGAIAFGARFAFVARFGCIALKGVHGVTRKATDGRRAIR